MFIQSKHHSNHQKTAHAFHYARKTIPELACTTLRGACEKSARSMISAMQRASGSVSSGSITDQVDSLTGAIEYNEALTTQSAADLLNISRPQLLKLLETGQIPRLAKVGRHRRVVRAAVLKYKRKRDIKRASALQALATISLRHKLGY